LVIETFLRKNDFVHGYDFFSFFSSGYYEIVKFLLARGANVHAMSELGTPLMDATLRRFPSIVKILLEHKSDVLLKLFVDMLSLTPNSSLFWVLLLPQLFSPVGLFGW
uniref:Uncharacterized protein n=1 Tax=Aegilops tauschii subsp. strangulata TaxID=200361 RepID=A0A453HJH0_AEGTS